MPHCLIAAASTGHTKEISEYLQVDEPPCRKAHHYIITSLYHYQHVIVSLYWPRRRVEQALLHTPLLRTFFMGAGHPREACPHRTRSQRPCLSCKLVRVISLVGSSCSGPLPSAGGVRGLQIYQSPSLAALCLTSASYGSKFIHEPCQTLIGSVTW